MSVLVADRTESKFEVLVHSIKIHDMIVDLCQRNFGVKDIDHLVRKKYEYGDASGYDYERYFYLLYNYKSRLEMIAATIVNNIRAANSIYPKNLHECEVKRDYQNAAIANCEQLISELQRIIDIFDVDVNVYIRYSKAIDREIDLIKRWRQKGNAREARLKGNS